MKLTRKLLLSICCFALCAALLLGGTLVLLLSPKTPADTTVPEETDADTTAEQTEAVTEAETEPQTQKIDPAVQNQLLISAQDFVKNGKLGGKVHEGEHFSRSSVSMV